MCRQRIINSETGFSLIEVIAAVFIIGIFVIPVSSLFMTSVDRNNESYKKNKAYAVAEAYMEDIKGKSISADENSIDVNGVSIPIGSDILTELFDKEDFLTYICIVENELLLPQYNHIKSLKVKVIVAEIRNKKNLVELESDISIF